MRLLSSSISVFKPAFSVRNPACFPRLLDLFFQREALGQFRFGLLQRHFGAGRSA